MSWLTNFVLPKIRAVVTRKAVSENLWHKCPGCEQMLFYRELDCRNCGHHRRAAAPLKHDEPPRAITAKRRFPRR